MNYKNAIMFFFLFTFYKLLSVESKLVDVNVLPGVGGALFRSEPGNHFGTELQGRGLVKNFYIN